MEIKQLKQGERNNILKLYDIIHKRPNKMTSFTNIENEQMKQLKTKLDFPAKCHIIDIY